jgi:hypothetical protein
MIRSLTALYKLIVFYCYDLQSELTYSGGGSFIFNLCRIKFLIIIFVVVSTLIVWNHLGFLIDDLLFSRWENVVIYQPLFIIGNARSGTTLMHKLISDNKNFTTMKLWEILFAVSITWKLLFHSLYSFDRTYLHSYLFNLVAYYDKKMFKHITSHPFSLFLPEEDEWLMIHIFSAYTNK